MVVENDNELDKPLKQMLKEFQLLRMQTTVQKSDPQTIARFQELKTALLLALKQKEQESQAEIERSRTRKNMLAKKLDIFAKQHDEKMRDEIIKEMEEYSRIKRFRYAQLASIQRNIDDIKKQ